MQMSLAMVFYGQIELLSERVSIESGIRRQAIGRQVLGTNRGQGRAGQGWATKDLEHKLETELNFVRNPGLLDIPDGSPVA